MMILTISDLLERIRQGESVAFADAIQVIGGHYDYTPVRFENGLGSDCLINEAGANEGSCKLFSFARLHHLSEMETLALFGDYYRRDVLDNPTGTDHGNIRNFMKYGWKGIRFNGDALSPHR